MLHLRAIALAGLVAAAFAQPVSAVTIWDEGVNGDLSGDPAAPTLVAFGPGTNSITGTTQAGDLDFFTITVPDGASFAQLLLTLYESADDLSFLAIESGPVITNLGTPTNLLGYMHVSAEFLDTNVLDDVAAGPGALGFTAPLGPGTYTVWMQQTGPELVAYGFDLVAGSTAVSEPPGFALFLLGLVALVTVRRQLA